MAAVIHHGGAGTSASGFRTGKPTIIVSFFADQPFWGWRVKELGIGPRHLVRKSLTSDKLAEAIDEATTDPGIARRAAVVGEQIRAEDGIRNATDYIEAYIKKPAHLYP
jgi:UDP:flavonoid glycosyltransferase YjiC (YdhE family)